MSGKAFRLVVAVGAVLALAGCVTVPEFQSLRRRVDGLEKGGGKTGSSDDWTKADGAGAKSTVPGGSRLADLDAEVTSLRDDVGRLQGEVEALKKELEKVRSERGGGAAGAAAAPAEPAAGVRERGCAGRGGRGRCGRRSGNDRGRRLAEPDD